MDTESQGVIPMYTVPATGGARRRAKHGGCDSTTTIVVVVILLLLLVIIYMVWRRRYRAKPSCGQYKGSSQQACQQMTQMCGGNTQCLNAVAHCMPVVDKLSQATNPAAVAAALSGPDLMSCANSIANVPPRYVAQLAVQARGAQACVPADVKQALNTTAYYDAMHNAAVAFAPLVPYSLDVARALPACPTPSGGGIVQPTTVW